MPKAVRLSLAVFALFIPATAHAQSAYFNHRVALATKYAEQMAAEYPCDESGSAETVPCLVKRLEGVDTEIRAMIETAKNGVFSMSGEEGIAFYRSNIQAAQDHWIEYRHLQCWHKYGLEPFNSNSKQEVNLWCELRASYLRMAEIEQSMLPNRN